MFQQLTNEQSLLLQEFLRVPPRIDLSKKPSHYHTIVPSEPTSIEIQSSEDVLPSSELISSNNHSELNTTLDQPITKPPPGIVPTTGTPHKQKPKKKGTKIKKVSQPRKQQQPTTRQPTPPIPITISEQRTQPIIPPTSPQSPPEVTSSKPSSSTSANPQFTSSMDQPRSKKRENPKQREKPRKFQKSTPKEVIKKPVDMCRFFIGGYCYKGDACPFHHDKSTFPCKFFHLYSTCTKGDKCEYSHKLPLSDDYRELLLATEKKIREDKTETIATSSANSVTTLVYGGIASDHDPLRNEFVPLLESQPETASDVILPFPSPPCNTTIAPSNKTHEEQPSSIPVLPFQNFAPFY